MIDLEQRKLLNSLLKDYNKEQIIWIIGYLQGKFNILGYQDDSIIEDTNSPSKQSIVDKTNIKIYYATETGNTKILSLCVAKSLKGNGFKSNIINMNRLNIDDLKKDDWCIFIVSTHGEGDPPDNTIKFFNNLSAANDNVLDGLNYSILGLGDKSYEIFCGAALILDKELKRLGAKDFLDTTLLDVDYQDYTGSWNDKIISTLHKKISTRTDNVQTHRVSAVDTKIRDSYGYSRLKPITGKIKEVFNLNDINSDKQTYHIEIEYKDNVTYTPGDAIGIILPKGDDGKEITPRLYSIASAPSLHKKEIHLTVSLAKHFDKNKEIGFGICSSYLATKKVDDEISFYISKNHLFNLPSMPDQDIIMIGPGTGIAPFRSFIYERTELGHTGKNWLFFGDRNAHCDFLYQAEWQEHLAIGNLNNIDLAFSRDQKNKVYVQHRLREKADDIMLWIDNGAALYVCGAKKTMSMDVENAIIDIISINKGIALELGREYLMELEEQNRYLKDVY